MNLIIKNLQKIVPISQNKIQRVALKVLSLEGVKLTGEITIVFVGDQEMREINLMYLGSDSSTDVISFDNSIKKNELLADIAISCDTAVRNARIFKTSPPDEINLYVVHGLLHLLGYDDNNKKNRLTMHKRQEYLLRAISQLCLSREPTP